MTGTTTITPSKRRYHGYTLDIMRSCEYNTDPFTDTELDAIDRYDKHIRGIPDCFDLAGTMSVAHPDFTRDENIGLIKSWFKMLTDWREQISVLHSELPYNAATEGLSKAAERYVGRELTDWQTAREGWRSGALEFFLGRDEHGYRYDWPSQPQGYRYDDGMFWVPAPGAEWWGL